MHVFPCNHLFFGYQSYFWNSGSSENVIFLCVWLASLPLSGSFLVNILGQYIWGDICTLQKDRIIVAVAVPCSTLSGCTVTQVMLCCDIHGKHLQT